MSARRLIANLDAVAHLRQAHGEHEPDPVTAATLALLAGADGVNVHLREDRAHTQDRDARVLRHTVRRGFSMDIAPLPELMKVVLELRPDSVTLVPPHGPQGPGRRTGVDVVAQLGSLGELVRALSDGKIEPCFLVAPDLEQIKAAHRVGAQRVRLEASRFAEAGPDREQAFEALRDAARLAGKLGLQVAVGGGLDAPSVRALAGVAEISEFCVGHALAARSLWVGFEAAVRELRALLD